PATDTLSLPDALPILALPRHPDESEVRDGREDGRTRAHHHVVATPSDLEPHPIPLPLVPADEERNPIPERVEQLPRRRRHRIRLDRKSTRLNSSHVSI